MKTIHFVAPLVASVLAYAMNPAVADTFGSGANAFEIEFVTIGDPGNPRSKALPSRDLRETELRKVPRRVEADS